MSGLYLRKLRKLHNLTQKYLAKKLGVSRQALCMWEANKREIKISFLKKISKIFNVSVDEIINKNSLKIITRENSIMKSKRSAQAEKVTKQKNKDKKATIKTKEAKKVTPKVAAKKTIAKKVSKKVTQKTSIKAFDQKKGKKVEFKLSAPDAKTVLLLGDFNSWDTKGIPLEKTKRGEWRTNLYIKPGRYEYKFMVDNQWWLDPANSNVIWNALGSQNSIVELN